MWRARYCANQPEDAACALYVPTFVREQSVASTVMLQTKGALTATLALRFVPSMCACGSDCGADEVETHDVVYNEKLGDLTRALVQAQAVHAGQDAKIGELLAERADKDAALRVKEEALAEESRRAEGLGAALLQTQKKLTALQKQHNELQKQHAELLVSETLKDVQLSVLQEQIEASTTQYEATLQERHAKPPRKVCRFFKKATGCRNGRECTFLHARPESPTKRRLSLRDNEGLPA